jgi:hypothetical protein
MPRPRPPSTHPALADDDVLEVVCAHANDDAPGLLLGACGVNAQWRARFAPVVHKRIKAHAFDVAQASFGVAVDACKYVQFCKREFATERSDLSLCGTALARSAAPTATHEALATRIALGNFNCRTPVLIDARLERYAVVVALYLAHLAAQGVYGHVVVATGTHAEEWRAVFAGLHAFVSVTVVDGEPKARRAAYRAASDVATDWHWHLLLVPATKAVRDLACLQRLPRLKVVVWDGVAFDYAAAKLVCRLRLSTSSEAEVVLMHSLAPRVPRATLWRLAKALFPYYPHPHVKGRDRDAVARLRQRTRLPEAVAERALAAAEEWWLWRIVEFARVM